MELEELRKLQTSMQEAARSFEQSVTSEVRSAETELQKIAQEANPTPAPPSSAVHDTSPPISETAVSITSASAPAPGQLTPAETSAQLQLELDSKSGDKRV